LQRSRPCGEHTLQGKAEKTVANFTYRGLFPLDCFERRNYTEIHKDAYRLYQGFHHRYNPTSDDREEARTRVEDIEVPWIVEVLIRGKTTGADRLLDWVVSFFGFERRLYPGLTLVH
jgi:hypothetical protein